jgi:hypothetical protein
MKKYKLEDLLDRKFAVFVENEEQWLALKAVNIFTMTTDYFGPKYYFPGRGSWITTLYSEHKRVEFREIDFENTKDMEKIIIGYKLIKPEYDNPAKLIAEVNENWGSSQPFLFEKDSNHYDRLVKAGVLDLWFEPVYKEITYCVGNWVWIEGNKGNGITDNGVYRLLNKDEKMRATGNTPGDCEFMFKWKLRTYFNTRTEHILRMATKSEILEAALLEAKYDGIEVGSHITAINNLSFNISGVVKEFFLYPYTNLNKEDGLVLWLTMLNGLKYCVYNFYGELQWKLTKFPSILINGYKAEFFPDYVKFGCVEIKKEAFIKILDGVPDISQLANRHVQGIQIGKGLFTIENIEEIIEYYNRIS